MKLPTRSMHSFAGGGNRVKPIGAANSDKGHMSSKIQSISTIEIQDGESLTEDASLSLTEGIRQGVPFLSEELVRLMMALILLVGSFLLIS